MNQIQGKGDFRHEEALASGSITPGMLLEQTSAAAATVKAHATEGGIAERLIAVENALAGETVDDVYLTTELVQYHVVAPGAEVQVLIESGSNVSIGEKLLSSGLGTFIPNGDEASGSEANVLAIALEALDISDSDDVDTLCLVRML